MKYEKIKEDYKNLENEILDALRSEIENSIHISKHTGGKAIKVNVFGYKELTIINDSFAFLDEDGYIYNLWCDCDFTDLVDILNQIE